MLVLPTLNFNCRFYHRCWCSVKWRSAWPLWRTTLTSKAINSSGTILYHIWTTIHFQYIIFRGICFHYFCVQNSLSTILVFTNISTRHWSPGWTAWQRVTTEARCWRSSTWQTPNISSSCCQLEPEVWDSIFRRPTRLSSLTQTGILTRIYRLRTVRTGSGRKMRSESSDWWRWTQWKNEFWQQPGMKSWTDNFYVINKLVFFAWPKQQCPVTVASGSSWIWTRRWSRPECSTTDQQEASVENCSNRFFVPVRSSFY